MYSFLDEIIHKDSLVFDIGANVGAMTHTYLARGVRVIAVEPVPEFAAKLRKQCPGATVVQKAVTRLMEGENIDIHVSGTLSTVVPKTWWTGRFGHIKSNRIVSVDTTTIDGLIEEYGTPDYIKIDCEGYDHTIMLGLTVPVPALSFEYIQEQRNSAYLALGHLHSLGFRHFNLMVGGMHPRLPDYGSLSEIRTLLESFGDNGMWGDIVALQERG